MATKPKAAPAAKAKESPAKIKPEFSKEGAEKAKAIQDAAAKARKDAAAAAPKAKTTPAA
jgi:hypothetical protein